MAALWCAVALSACPGPAAAQVQTTEPTGVEAAPPPVDPPYERRGSFTAGGQLGLLVGTADGYPADYDKRSVDAFAVDTGAVATFGLSYWLGVTLQDWFTFALGSTGLVLEGNGLQASGAAFFVRLESFPLYGLGGPWRDLGVATNFGLGFVTIARDGKEQASGLGASTIGVGLFYEALHFSRFALGPSVEYLRAATQNLTAQTGLLGLRFVYYDQPENR